MWIQGTTCHPRKLTFLLYCVTFSIVKWHLPHVNVSRVNTILIGCHGFFFRLFCRPNDDKYRIYVLCIHKKYIVNSELNLGSYFYNEDHITAILGGEKVLCERLSQNSVRFDLGAVYMEGGWHSFHVNSALARQKRRLRSVKSKNAPKEFEMREKLTCDVKRNPQAIPLCSQKRKQRRTLPELEELFSSFVAYWQILKLSQPKCQQGRFTLRQKNINYLNFHVQNF